MIYTQRGLDWALNFIDSINADPSKYVIYKQSRPIANLKHMMVTTTDLYPNNTAFMMKFPGTKEYESISFTRVLEEMNALGTALIAKGLKGKRIAVCGENCYYWCLSYLAAVCGVGVVVPLDKELPDGDLKGLAAAAEVACVFTTKKHQAMFEEMLKDHEGSMEYVVGMYTKPEEAGDVLSLEALIEEGKKLIAAGETSYINAQIDEEAMGILLYTSGTTGLSKGVMLSHKNICADLMSAPNLLEVLPTDRFFNVLPLHHTYACTCDFLVPMYKGACMAFCEGLKYIQKNLKEVKPTLFLGVPAIFEALYKTINKNIKKQGKDKTVAKVLKINKFTKKIGLDLVPKFMGQILDVFGGELRTIIAGGAANVVHNCATLGGSVTAVGLVGDDRQADGICAVLENAGVDTTGLLRDAERPTISKTRIIAGGRATVSQQIVRLDRESHAPMSRAMESAMLRYLDGVLPETDGIVLSDYGAGTITEAVKGKLIGYAREHDIPSIVDSRYGIHRFSGIGYVKQNDAELAAAVGRKLPDAPAIYAAGRELLEELGADGVLVTRGELGMVLVEKDGSVSDIPVTDKSEVYDVSGAGDTCVATVILALAAGIAPESAARLSNYASGIAVRKLGTATVSAEELKKAVGEA